MNIVKQSGLTLVEILITILVMSVGALGVASMQIAGLKYNAGAQTRTQASLLANDIMDRMRANRVQAITSDLYKTNGFDSAADVPTAPTPDCYTSECTEEEIVASDKYAWLQQVSTLLPNGQAQIATVTLPGGQRMYQITLSWRQIANVQGGDSDDEIKQFAYRGVI